jgi:type I restriction enzyme, S subunit
MISDLPSTWIAAPLSAVCEINPRTKSELKPNDLVSFVPMAAVSEHSGSIVASETRPLEEVRKGFTPFQDGDVLFAKITPCMENGKAAIARSLVNGQGYGSTEFHVLRPSSLIMAEWLFAIIRTAEFRRAAAASFQGAVGQQRVTSDFLQRFRIPLPPLSEQQRIVDILQEAEEIRRLHDQAEAKTADLGAAIFASVFGAPANWSGNTKLGDLVRIVGGGTPSKSVDHFFTGSIPWATSKDVKKPYLDDTQDHVTEEAIQLSATNLVPKGTLLVVVKSKILAHSLPMAITEVPMCFGQDLKGLIPHEGIAPEFLLYALNAQADRVLSRARGANTEGLTLEALKSLPIPNPDGKLISLFAKSCTELKELGSAVCRSERLFLAASASISAHAFTGQLTEEWREKRQKKLATEARDRDAALQKAGAAHPLARRSTIQEMDRIWDEQTDGIYAELNREQRALLREIERMMGGVDYGRYFTAEQLAADSPGPLHRHPQAIESHLSVFAVRGLIIPVSRPRNDSTGNRFAACYRLPLKEDDVRPERLEHQRRLAVGNI